VKDLKEHLQQLKYKPHLKDEEDDLRKLAKDEGEK
jgi:hypothetical protein